MFLNDSRAFSSMPHIAHSLLHGSRWSRLVIVRVVLLSLLLAGLAMPGPGQGSEQDAGAGEKRILLLDTIEFKGSHKVLTQWLRILGSVKEQVRALNSCGSASGGCPPGAASWQELIAQARSLKGFEQLKFVSRYVNKWPYRLDMDVYGVGDYWATPQEFLKLSGDCEDYSITKYFVFRELGFAPGQLRVVIVRDTIRNIAHAVLAVYLDETIYILDNLTDGVFEHTRYKHYVAQYSFDELSRWAHIPLKK